jgi:hypothetical protein
MYTILVLVVLVVMFLAAAIRILNEYERAVIFRLGRIIPTKGPGLIILIPLVDRMVRVDTRTVTMDVPSQDIITRDNVSIKVNAVVYFRVVNSMNAIVEVENYLYATSQLAQTTPRSVCGQVELDEILASREKVNLHIQEILDRATDPWGIKVTHVEVKYIDLPQEMQRAMAKQARPSASGAPRSSPPRASSRPPRSSPRRRRSCSASRCRCSCDTCRRGADRDGEQHHHRVPDSHRHAEPHDQEGGKGRGVTACPDVAERRFDCGSEGQMKVVSGA